MIKSNGQWCRNYARKGMTCCWSHRNLEVSGEVILTGNLFMKFKQPEIEREWPTLDEVNNVILREGITTYDSLVLFQKIWLTVAESENWSKYERRMLALIFTEFHFTCNVPFIQGVLDTVVKKLQEANYDPVYIHFASQLKST